MKALKVLSFVVVFGLMACGISRADNLKIAYIDLSKVFDGYQKTKEFDAVLQKQGEEFQKTRDAMIMKIQDSQSKLDLMKDSEKASLEADIEKQKNEVVAFDKEKRTELAKQRDAKVREILGEIQNIVSGIAKRDGYTYVLNDRVMVYGDPQYNITDEVSKALNEGK
jgi:Skp family chaperone for outer membrane proteins